MSIHFLFPNVQCCMKLKAGTAGLHCNIFVVGITTIHLKYLIVNPSQLRNIVNMLPWKMTKSEITCLDSNVSIFPESYCASINLINPAESPSVNQEVKSLRGEVSSLLRCFIKHLKMCILVSSLSLTQSEPHSFLGNCETMAFRGTMATQQSREDRQRCE